MSVSPVAAARNRVLQSGTGLLRGGKSTALLPGFTLLIVDDNPDLRHVFQPVLAEQGYRVLTASNGKDGLSMAIAHLPDAILTDWHMPELGGAELCRHLCRHAVLASMPVAVISAGNPPGEKQAPWTFSYANGSTWRH